MGHGALEAKAMASSPESSLMSLNTLPLQPEKNAGFEQDVDRARQLDIHLELSLSGSIDKTPEGECPLDKSGVINLTMNLPNAILYWRSKLPALGALGLCGSVPLSLELLRM
jgi:hypothetical protein